MPPRRSVVTVLLACIAMGALPALVVAIFGHTGLRAFGISVFSGFVYASCIAIPCWAVFNSASCWMTLQSPWKRYAFLAGVLAFFGVAGCLVANLLLIAVGIIPLARLRTSLWWSLRICLFITFTGGVLTSVIVALRGQLRSARQTLHEREIDAAEARFASLESRVRPHFLFNTLNSISALVREDPNQAERTIERLAALLRFTLDTENAGLVTLAEELRIVRDYLEIERVRFGPRLRYSIDAAEDAITKQVPALSVQTLVENSVKYAVGASATGAEINVRAMLNGPRLTVEVRDDGPGIDPARVVPGHGLDLLRRRLTSLFGTSASLEIEGTRVAFNIEQ